MKRFIFFLALVCSATIVYAQPISDSISKAEELIETGFPKDAAALLNKEFSKLSCEKDAPLYVKAHILYITALSKYEEDAAQLSLKHLNTYLDKCNEPAKQIFHSYLGELYSQYGNSHSSWSETKNIASPSDDLSTWSKAQLDKKALEHFRASVENPQKLYQIPIADYELIVEIGEDDEVYRPTLYDALAYRVFGFANEYGYEYFFPKHIELPSPLPAFMQMTFEKDSSLLELCATTYQNLLRLHETSNNIPALIQADLSRLAFFADDDKSKCIAAYDYLLATFPNHPAVALAAFAKANTLSTEDSYELMKDKGTRYFRAEAATICRTYSQKFPDSDGGRDCAILLKQIEKIEISSLELESVLIPQKPALAKVTFKNATHLNCRIYSISQTEIATFDDRKAGRSTDFYKGIIRNKQPLTNWNIRIPDTKDYLSHSTEFEIPPMEKSGTYLLMLTPDTVFSVDSSLFLAQRFQVSSLFPFYTKNGEGNGSFLVADRTTGDPLERVLIQIFDKNNPNQILETVTTDKDGMASLSKKHDSEIKITFSLNKDTLRTNDFWNSSQYNDERSNYLSASLFTDRAVYRPGQTVYFKGVLTEVSETKVVLAVQKNIEITLRDANYREVGKQNLTSNDMGGFDGSFIIPSGILTGNMRIQTPHGEIYFRVEEYKRPRFEVTFDKLKTAYRLNEEVKITGRATMLNGLPLENATVTYNVSRTAFRPFKYYYDRSEEVLKEGTLTTQADGTFEIVFKTLSEQEDTNGNLYYNFEIVADVTDITGEMQSGSTIIGAGANNSVRIDLKVPPFVMGKENDQLEFSFQNYTDESISVSGSLRIEELEQPKTPYIKRSWTIPDMQIIPKDEFIKKFPQYSYDTDSLAVVKQVYFQAIESSEKGSLKLSEKLKKSGKYRATIATTDKSGRKIEEEVDFTFLKENEKKFPIAENALFEINKRDAIAIGDTLKIFMGSAIKDAKVFYTLFNRQGIQKQTWIEIGEKTTVIEIPVDSSMLPSLDVKFLLIQNNKLYDFRRNISIIDSSKNLQINISGIRDKTLPGSKERWEVKISDNNGKPVPAAFFATMCDAALDKFGSLSWRFSPRPNYRDFYFSLQPIATYFPYRDGIYNDYTSYGDYSFRTYSSFNWFGYNFYASGGNGRMYKTLAYASAPSSEGEEEIYSVVVDETAILLANDSKLMESSDQAANVRQNFSETAFFYPDLRTDKDGNIILQFTLPDALTRWNMQAIGYTKTLQIGKFEHSIVTESDFMVMPNLPRYLRVGDTCVFTTRIANKTANPLSGKAKIVVENMATGKVLAENILESQETPFTAKGNESITVSWKYAQPDNADALMIRITATSGNFTDGEEYMIPVLPSEITLLESIPIEITKAGTHNYSFENLTAATKAQKLTVEMSTSPVWYAIQALPVLSSYPYESADQLFNRYYAADLGRHIVSSMPQIEKIFDQWRNFEPDAFLSNLEKNQDLKTALLSETPWVMKAGNETTRKQRLATLFDVNNLKYSQGQIILKLQQQQLPSGGFSWYPNMPASEYITRYIVTGIGKLKALTVWNDELNYIVKNAIQYLDQEWWKQYEKATQKGAKYIASSYDIAYLYARSFHTEALETNQYKVLETVLNDCVKKQTESDLNTRAMLALVLNRHKRTAEAQKIAKSLDNYSIGNANTGKYWRTQQGSASASDITLSCLMVEVYNEVLKNKTASNEVLTWLLRNKRTNDWKSPMATADAVYALVSSSEKVLVAAQITTKVGNETLAPEKQEAGTGRFTIVYNKNEIKPDMKNITVTTTEDKQVWGGAYLQYQTAMDKVKGNKNEHLSVEREIFKRSGEQWLKLEDNAQLQVGDKITVRLTVKANRDFDYVHLRDMRAVSFEPVEQTSGYVWKGLGYYCSVRDAFVDLFFNQIPRGTWTVDYELFVTQTGTFSNGFSSIQCLYAPEFSATSDGMRIGVKNR